MPKNNKKKCCVCRRTPGEDDDENKIKFYTFTKNRYVVNWMRIVLQNNLSLTLVPQTIFNYIVWVNNLNVPQYMVLNVKSASNSFKFPSVYLQEKLKSATAANLRNFLLQFIIFWRARFRGHNKLYVR